MQTITKQRAVWKLYRCAECAGEPPPADLEQLPSLAPAQSGDAAPAPATDGGNLRKPEIDEAGDRELVDVKVRQAGER